MKQSNTGKMIRQKPLHHKSRPVPPVPAPSSEKEPAPLSRQEPPKIRKLPARVDYPEEAMTLEMLDQYGEPPTEEGSMRNGRHTQYCAVVNLEKGMPTVAEALSRMDLELQTLRRQGCCTVKLIHGYGSTGTGGRIRTAVLRELAARKSGRQIVDYVPGPEFGPFGFARHPALNSHPELTKDRDWGRENSGITLVIL